MNKNVHVTHNANGGWNVKSENTSRAMKTLSTKQEAINYGRNVAIGRKTELVIHGLNGRIQDKDSYGNDPVPPRDRVH